MNTNYIFFIVFIIAVVILVELLKTKTNPGERVVQEMLPYRKKPFLMTASEYKFFQALEQAVAGKYYIVPQVALADIVEVLDGYKWNKSYRSKIDKKTLDFVLFNKAGYTPHLVIELDDASHLRQDRMQRDEFLKNILDKTGIKLVRVKNLYSYDIQEVVKLIE